MSLTKSEEIFNHCTKIKILNKKRQANNDRIAAGGQGKFKPLEDFPYTAYAMARKDLEARGDHPWSLKYACGD